MAAATLIFYGYRNEKIMISFIQKRQGSMSHGTKLNLAASFTAGIRLQKILAEQWRKIYLK
jgi:hypothetical protein